MDTVKFLIIETSDKEFDVISQDGGIACVMHNEEHMITELYGTRMTPNDKIINIFDKLDEGSKNFYDYPEHQVVTTPMINEAMTWLYLSTNDTLQLVEHVELDDKVLWSTLVENWLKENYVK